MSIDRRDPDAEKRLRRGGLLSTGDMARLSGSTLRTVRFYEQEGLICPSERTSGGHRLFATAELQKLKLVGELRASGISIEEIKALISCKQQSESGASAARDVIDKLDQKIASMTERIELMESLRKDLISSKSWFTGCLNCAHSELFPEHCKNCEHVQTETSIPKAARVIWDINK